MPISWTCLDASFVIGLVTHPNREALRARLRGWQTDRIRMAAPGLIHYELANAGYQMERHGQWDATATDQLMEMALSLPLEIVSDPDLHREATALARRLSLPATYDAHYHAVAQRLECELWTLDRKLVGHASKQLPDRVRLAG